jgi:hypothetical protein
MSDTKIIWEKLTAGLDRAPSTDFERMLARFDELNKIRGERELTKEERRKYDIMANYIDSQFKPLFELLDKKMQEKAEKQRERRERREQRGGAADDDVDEKPDNNDNILMNIWKWVKDQYNAFMAWIRAAAEENQQKALAATTPANMMKILGMTSTGDPNAVADQITKFDEKVQNALANIQKTVTNGVGNAASAAIDILLNALSMIPVFGTGMLMWRMFQNLLVIVGASMSVQATNVTVAREVLAGIEEAKKGPEVIANLEERALKKEEAAEEAETAAITTRPAEKDERGRPPPPNPYLEEDKVAETAKETAKQTEAGTGAVQGEGVAKMAESNVSTELKKVTGDAQDALSNLTKGAKDNASTELNKGAQGVLNQFKNGTKDTTGLKSVNDAAGNFLNGLKKKGGTRKMKNRNRENRGNNIASYARKIQQSLKRFHKLGAPRLLHKPPTATTAYALKLTTR